MLSLGDSVVFGYVDGKADDFANPDRLVAYPNLVGYKLQLAPTNPSCPGETTASFLSTTGADNGCREFRARFPLHVGFTGIQMEFARRYLQSHKNIRLVTLSLGANDVFLLQSACHGEPGCIQERLKGELETVRKNLETILSALRANLNQGVLMVVNYYCLDYSNVEQTRLTIALNNVLASAAADNGAVVADAFGAFKAESVKASAGGMTCKTGLLATNYDGTPGCDVHPSQAGQRLLAKTVLATLHTANLTILGQKSGELPR